MTSTVCKTLLRAFGKNVINSQPSNQASGAHSSAPLLGCQLELNLLAVSVAFLAVSRTELSTDLHFTALGTSCTSGTVGLRTIVCGKVCMDTGHQLQYLSLQKCAVGVNHFFLVTPEKVAPGYIQYCRNVAPVILQNPTIQTNGKRLSLFASLPMLLRPMYSFIHSKDCHC